jgi:predicted small secreted protein
MRPVRRSGHLVAALLLVASLVTACHSRSDFSSQTPADGVPLEIANHNWSDVVIYIVRDGQRSRLGVATAASATSFVLPRRMFGQAGELQLFGRPIGAAGSALTETVIVQPGQWVEWTLESDLDRSAIGVF